MDELQFTLSRRMAEVHKYLAIIEDKAGSLGNSGDANWGHAGSLGHVVENLKEEAAFLGYFDEA
jgi:hypothetical protein